MIKYTSHGLTEIRHRILALRHTKLAQETRDKADARFVQAMRRRTIPVRTGRLKGSLTSTGHRDHLARLSGKRLELGTRVPYAARQAHQWQPLSQTERIAIFVTPLLEAIRKAWKEGG